MYTAPPEGEESDRDVRPEKPSLDASETKIDGGEAEADGGETEAETRTNDRSSPDLDPTTATTDANWTGTVSADSTVPADD